MTDIYPPAKQGPALNGLGRQSGLIACPLWGGAVTIIGVDIGLPGAIALIDESGELIAVHDVPCLADGPKRARRSRALAHGLPRPGERIWIRDHERGDRSLDFVTHDYVEHPSPGGAS